VRYAAIHENPPGNSFKSNNIFMNISMRCIIIGLLIELLPMTVAKAQNSIAIPGAPKGVQRQLKMVRGDN